ncbi:MAG TPA: DUF11 domain-containing protein [Chloroflexi bacterium]|nr:DUF11 domain-containing protein [Chloroflexota bacterium]
MNQHKLILSIALGIMLTIGLLAGFGLSRSAAMVLTERPAAINQIGLDGAIWAQDAISTAHIVVVFSGERAAVRSISWTGTLTRVGALKAAGFSVETEPSFGAICNINGDGCPASDCFCSDNWWWLGLWDTQGATWNAPWPLPDPVDGDILGFRNNTSWGPPVLPAQSYVGSLKALEWLQDQQQANGDFGSANNTADVLMAVGANGMDAASWRHSPSLLANMLSTGADLANKNAAGVGKLAVGLAAQDSCWPIGAQRPISYYDPSSGMFDDDTLYQAWGILGTAALSETVPVSAVESLKDAQLPNGGWEWAVGMGADTNDTALALQALIAAGEPVTSTSVVSGLAYLEYAQNDDGGFPYNPDSTWGTDSDTNSTAYVVQALFATGEDPRTGTWTVTNSNPISYLLSMQLPDGSFEWQKGYGADQMATQQAIPALLHRAYPLAVGGLESCYGLAGNVSEPGPTSKVSTQVINEAISDVTVWVEGSGDLYFGTTDATGRYTASVPSIGAYELTPSKGNYVFSPTSRTVEVGGEPGDITTVDEAFTVGDADLSIVKTGNVDTVSPGDSLTYTITACNAGPFAATNVVVTDILPSEVTSPSVGTVILPDPPGTIVMPQKVWWSLGTLEAAECQTMTLTVKVQPGASGKFTNTAIITSSVADDMPDNNESHAVTGIKYDIYLPLVLRNTSWVSSQ